MKSPARLAETISGGAWKPYRHLVHVSNRLVRAVADPDQTFLSIQMSVRHGKALAVDTPIPTPSGVREMGDLRVGDEVFDGDGAVTVVTAVSPVWNNRPCYEVTVSDGETIVADENHEWVVEKGSGRECVMTTAEMAAWLSNPSRAVLRIRPVCAGYREQRLPVDPWLLGYWLGNGDHSGGGLTCNTADVGYVRGRVTSLGYGIGDRQGSDDGHFGVLGLWPQLKGLGFGGKGNRFVPDVYLCASREQRLALLNGLIDSDGYVAPDGQVEFCSTVQRLAFHVKQLVNSLGVKASMIEGDATLNGRVISRRYRVRFYMDGAAGSPRKAAGCRDAARSHRYVTGVTAASPRDTVCIEVASGSHTFLCGRSHVRTHNSEMTSKYFVVWFLGMFPDKNVLIVSYNEDFAKKWGRVTRDLYAEWGSELFGQTVREDASSTTEWLTTANGGLRAVGAGGSITGLGFDLIIIDDPIKNSEEAASPAANEKMRDWYDTTLRTRLMPGGTMVLTMARWSDFDLAAYVTGEMERETVQAFPDPWQVLKLPAVAEAPADAPDGWVDEIGRRDGDPLWPEVWPLEMLRPMMGTAGWDSLYQQSPLPKSGGMFPKENWRVATFPSGSAGWRRVRFWDTAASSGKGDWTVGVLMGLDPENNLWVLDVVRDRVDAAGVERLLVDTAHRDGRSVAVRYEEAKAAAGKATTQAYARLLVGFDFKGVPVEGNKAQRAALYAAAQQNRLVVLTEASWNGVFIEEHARFQRTKHDDQVDAASGAFRELTGGGPVSVTAPSQVVVADPVSLVRRRLAERERGRF